MAKVMVSLPDDLLERLDAEAQGRGSTRSGVVRHFIQEALGDDAARLAVEMSELEGAAAPHGGRVAEQIKQSRPA